MTESQRDNLFRYLARAKEHYQQSDAAATDPHIFDVLEQMLRAIDIIAVELVSIDDHLSVKAKP